MKSYDYASKGYTSQPDYILLKTQELEALFEKTQRSKQASNFRSGWQKFWNAVAAIFVQSSEPKIYQKRDRFGNLYFQVYDPQTGRSSVFNTEAEVRFWIDQRYYEV